MKMLILQTKSTEQLAEWISAAEVVHRVQYPVRSGQIKDFEMEQFS